MGVRISTPGFGRRKLGGPAGADRRPTRARVRQSLFDILGQRLDGLRVLDLYAGLGTFGLEAAGRGAAEVVFVEHDRAAARALAEAARRLLGDRSFRVVDGDVDRALADLGRATGRFDLVFADPPYDLGVAPGVPARVAGSGVLSAGGRLVVEHSDREDVPDRVPGLDLLDARRYGRTRLAFYRRSPGPGAGDGGRGSDDE